MSVLIVTSLGDIVVDLHTDRCPLTCKNFLKLCKIKYYNGCLFHNVQKDFTAQTGDPTGTGSGGDSIYKYLYGDQARFFGDEIHLDLKHSKTGTVAMASAGQNLNASQFYMTLRDDLDYLDEKHTIFGEVAEGLETLSRINEAYVDEKGRPYKNIRIKHTYILEDPFDDPPQLAELVPDASPEGKPKDEVDDEVRLEDDWVPMDEQLAPGELEEIIRTKEAHSRAVVLESIGDIPDAEIKPPENVLFVCKLNPVTEDEDLHTIFSRFGTVTSADIIRDFKTGDSLCYAFVEFEDTDACNQAYHKMDNALIDDRRIHVDFSQSVAKLWSQYRRKDQQNGNKKGCFKCGAPDHIAKDCTGSPTAKHQPAKYILKDDNTQRGSDSKSRYEMVFDGESGGSPQRKKAHGKFEVQDLNGKSNGNHQNLDERKSRDSRNRDLHDRRQHSDRSIEQREDERAGGRIHSRSGRDQGHGRREGRDFRNESGSIHRDGKVHDEYKKRSLESDSPLNERHGREYIKRSTDEGRHRDERESKNRSNDKSNPGDRRGDRHYEKGSADNNLRGDTRDERERKRSVEKESHGGRRDDSPLNERHGREYIKRSTDEGRHRDERESKNKSNDKSNPGDRRGDRHYEKGSADNNLRGDTRDERERKRSVEKESHGGRRDDSPLNERHGREYIKRSTDEGRHRDERESKNKSNDKSNPGDRRGDRHYEKGSADNNSRGDTRDEGERKRSVEKESHGGRRDDREYRKRNAEIAYHGNRRDERDYKRRSTDDDVRADRIDDGSERKGKVHDNKRDRRDESYGRKAHNNSDGHKSSREERDYEKRITK